MCNLYSLTKGQQAIRELTRAMRDVAGNLPLFPGVFRAYDEVWPLSPGYAVRIALYQLYPLLVHVNLFGSSYVERVERSLARYV